MDVKTGHNQDKPAHVASRRAYYDALATRIQIPGIGAVERDTLFDDNKMRSAGIRLVYTPRASALAGVKDGILLGILCTNPFELCLSPFDATEGRATEQ